MIDHVALVHAYQTTTKPEQTHYGATCVACHFAIDTVAWRDKEGASHRLTEEMVAHLARRHGDDPTFMGTHEEIEIDCACVWCATK